MLRYPMLHFGGLTGNAFPLAVLHMYSKSSYRLVLYYQDVFALPLLCCGQAWYKLLYSFNKVDKESRHILEQVVEQFCWLANLQPCHLITTCPQTCPQQGYKPSEHIQISSSLEQG